MSQPSNPVSWMPSTNTVAVVMTAGMAVFTGFMFGVQTAQGWVMIFMWTASSFISGRLGALPVTKNED